MRDTVEQKISDQASARAVLREHIDARLDQLEYSNEQQVCEFGDSCREFAQRALDAMILCLARIVLRNGSASPLHRYYHDELHPFDLLERLQRLHEFAPGSIQAREFFALCMFSTAHDLRQDQPGYDTDCVGYNERASAEEFARILDLSGFDRNSETSLYSLMRDMIHGTTFYDDEFTCRGTNWPGGALAPVLADAARNGDVSGNSNHALDEAGIRLVFMATDIDTANVADPFPVFIDRASRLCREVQNIAGKPYLDSGTAREVFEFCTDLQERYFFILQRFFTQESQACFRADKDANGVKLKAVIRQMREKFIGRLAEPDHGIEGEVILETFQKLSREQEAESVR